MNVMVFNYATFQSLSAEFCAIFDLSNGQGIKCRCVYIFVEVLLYVAKRIIFLPFYILITHIYHNQATHVLNPCSSFNCHMAHLFSSLENPLSWVIQSKY